VTTDILSQDRVLAGLESSATPRQLSDALGVAQQAWTRALECCADRMGLASPEAAVNEMRQGNGRARMHCCHGLADEIAASLRLAHQNIQGVYAPDCDTCPQDLCLDTATLNTPFVHLLVWADKKTPALSSRTATLGNALARVCQESVGTQDLPTVLDVRVIQDADLEKLLGSGQKQRWSIRLQAYLLAMNELTREL
jgi:hypothetical protein